MRLRLRSEFSPSPTAWLTVAPAIVVMAWGGNHFTPLLPMYRSVEGYSSVDVNLFFAFYVLGLVPGFLLSGPISNRFGNRAIVLTGLALGVLASTLLSLGAPTALWMCIGRLIAGISVATAMVVGTNWIRELSQANLPRPAGASLGARRATITLTVGLGAGAGVSGALAQWAPWPTVLPYLIQAVLSAGAAALLIKAPNWNVSRAETPISSIVAPQPAPTSFRFYTFILPLAPWVFTAAALAYAVVPALVSTEVGDFSIAFAALMTLLTLGTGLAIQPLVPVIARLTSGRDSIVGLLLAFVGIVVCIGVSLWTSLLLAILAAIVLGAAYGICLVSGLIEVQAGNEPRMIARATGIYYSLTYVGFLLPVILATLSQTVGYPTLLASVGVLCLGCAAIVATHRRTTQS